MITHLGLIQTSLIDVPGKVAATLFTHGCPLSCPYCHNERLRTGPVPVDFFAVDEVLRFLKKRRGLLEAVCVSGGEPFVHSDIGDLVAAIRDMGYYVKIDSSGINPGRLKELVDRGLVDMVALDLKTAPDHYRRVGGGGEAVLESLAVLRGSGVAYELRTTVAPQVLGDEDMTAIIELLEAEERYAIAQYRPTGSEQRSLDPYAPETLRRWCNAARRRGVDAFVRGVS